MSAPLMTTVTEAAKRLGVDLSSLEKADLAALRNDPVLAQQFARRLALAAKELVPNATWAIEDLRDVLEVAVLGAQQDAVRIVEGRYLRKRVREQCAFADRYGDPFALLVAKMQPEPADGAYSAALESVVQRLRRSDMVTIYRRRIALLLPRMHREALPTLVDRVRERLDQAGPTPVVEEMRWVMYPDPALTETQAVLDWLEDELRLDIA